MPSIIRLVLWTGTRMISWPSNSRLRAGPTLVPSPKVKVRAERERELAQEESPLAKVKEVLLLLAKAILKGQVLLLLLVALSLNGIGFAPGAQTKRATSPT